MKKVLYLITELDPGGAERALYALATRIDRRKYEPMVVCLTGRGKIGASLEEADVEVIYLDMKSPWDFGAWFRLRALLGERRPNILHAFLFHGNMAAKLAGIGQRPGRIICSVRVDEPRWWHLYSDRLTRGLVDVVTCVSEATRRYTHKHTKIPLNKLVVIPNGVDPEQCDMPLMAAPDAWRFPPEAPVVAWVGRLSEQKDPCLLLRAASCVLKEIPETIFAFAGTGPLAETCQAEAARLDIAERVRWLGWLDDIRPLLARMDVMALTSKWEGMPNVLLEAMACRKPVVATEVGGCPEIVVHGKTGFLVPWNDPQAFADRLVRLLSSDPLRTDFGTAARDRVEQKFSIQSMVEANERLYEG